MEESVKEAVEAMVGQYGPAVCDDVRRCEGLLKDLCGPHPREIRVLSEALREGVPGRLLAAMKAGESLTMVVGSLSQHLDDLGNKPELARWSVEVWASALGLAAEDRSNRLATPPPPRRTPPVAAVALRPRAPAPAVSPTWLAPAPAASPPPAVSRVLLLPTAGPTVAGGADRPLDKPRAYLTVLAGEDKGKALPLRREAMIVGRGHDCDIVLFDPLVSRKHFRLIWARERYKLMDLDSGNGTLVGGQRSRELVLEDGTEITVGATVMRVTYPGAAAAKTLAIAAPKDRGRTAQVQRMPVAAPVARPPALVRSAASTDNSRFPIAVVILGVLGALGSAFLGTKWLTDLHSTAGELALALTEATVQGSELAALERAAYALLAGAAVGMVVSVIVAIRKGNSTVNAVLLITAGAAPIVFSFKALFGVPMVLAGLVAFLVKHESR